MINKYVLQESLINTSILTSNGHYNPWDYKYLSPFFDFKALSSAAKRSSYLEDRWSLSAAYRTTVAKPLDTKASATLTPPDE